METTEIARIARSHAVMVRAQGPDPKGLKMRRHAFHHHQDGLTTLSASGFLLPESLIAALHVLERVRLDGRPGGLVVTVASVVECFLPVRQNAAESLPPDKVILPDLIPGTRIDVLVDGGVEGGGLSEINLNPSWREARLLALVNVPSAASALQQLVRRNGSLETGQWDVGWSLAPFISDQKSVLDVLNDEVPVDIAKNLSHKINSTTTIAFLGIVSMVDVCPADVKPTLPDKGASLLVMGSPFGILSPSHFFNSVSVGTVANSCPAGSSCGSLILADIRCLPGMEGAPVYDQNGQVGILARPLRQKSSTVEIQLVITWKAITTACNLQQNEFQTFSETDEKNNFQHTQDAKTSDTVLLGNRSLGCLPNPFSPCNLQSPLEMAIASVVLVAVGDEAWASGVVVNTNGLLLTNAHLLQPWSYGRSLLSISSKSNSMHVQFERSIQKQDQTCSREKEITSSSPKASRNIVGNVQHNYIQDSKYRTYPKLRVRLNHSKPWIWVDAKVVYISQGPMDVALLQLESIPHPLVPINVDYQPPVPGSKVHVIGHGPFGPQSDANAHISTGVVSRVIMGSKSMETLVQNSLLQGSGSFPVMIETTAAVYAGMSGGAVVNSVGLMIGLVTSNARHGSSVIIPEINFSIPSSILEPIFKFSVEPNRMFLLAYDKPDSFLSSVWALRPSSPSETRPPRDGKDKATKGSRFAEFLEKRQAENQTLNDSDLGIKRKFPASSKPVNSKL